MKLTFNQNVIEFIAKIICDMGKAILTVGFASYFFEKLVLPLRIGFVFIGVVFLAVSVILIMTIKKGDS